MSSILNVLVRKDLNMRKGKMAAQSAHAGGKLFLEILKKSENKLILSKNSEKQFLDFLSTEKNKVKIHMTMNEDTLNSELDKSKPFSIIVDNGRTEFHGVATTTCAAYGIFDNVDLTELYVPQTYGSEIIAKQIFVFSKENPLPKEIACELAVESCLKVLYTLMVETEYNGENLKCFDLSIKSAVNDWIKGAFGKIAVSTKTDKELDELSDILKENGFLFETLEIGKNRCIAIAPQYPSDIDPFTRQLSLI
jgi:PTH2 family peptidyl-tRNA hydrolase